MSKLSTVSYTRLLLSGEQEPVCCSSLTGVKCLRVYVQHCVAARGMQTHVTRGTSRFLGRADTLSDCLWVCRVMQRGLHCIQQLTASDWLKQPQHRCLLQAFLRAFGRQSDSPEQEPTSKAGVMKASQVSRNSLSWDAMAKVVHNISAGRCM